MKGTSWMRLQGNEDALLNRVLVEHGMTEVPQFKKMAGPAGAERYRRWKELAALRDGPVGPDKSLRDASEHVRLVKEKGLALGAALVCITRLRPEFVELGKQLDYDWIIGLLVTEDYGNVVKSAAAVEAGAFAAYTKGAEISTELARCVREELGHAALAHHAAACEIQALPALHAAGAGELGRHGSLIHPDLGSFWRPAFVTTTLPLTGDAPTSFGVQDYCMNCRLCEKVCPGDAVAAATDFIVTDGVKRWLIDNEKCYPFSRLRNEYCHLCVDVCPYIHKENGDDEKKVLYKMFVAQRKLEGFSAPKSGDASFPQEPSNSE